MTISHNPSPTTSSSPSPSPPTSPKEEFTTNPSATSSSSRNPSTLTSPHPSLNLNQLKPTPMSPSGPNPSAAITIKRSISSVVFHLHAKECFNKIKERL